MIMCGWNTDSESAMYINSALSDTINLDEAAAFLRTLVRDGGDMLLGYRASQQFTSIQKSGVDVTTEADQALDRFLQDSLSNRYPQSAFLTEESAPSDPAGLEASRSTEYLWVIDPLDGTVNFTRGHPNFAISVALLHKGEICLGAVYLPVAGKLYEAQRDKEGAFLNGNPIQISHTSSLREAAVAFDWSWDLEKRKQIVRWLDRLSGHVRQLKCMGSAAADLSSLAEGLIDVYIHSGLKPWDVAAAGLIVRNAGAVVSLPDGGSWTPFNSMILAANPELHPQIMKLIA
jgi:myo-inositol-1(or 4)-monophosphatase